MFAALKKY